MTKEEIMAWLEQDIKQDKPLITNSIFSGKELATVLGIEYEVGKISELLNALELAHYIERTNKIGPDGEYYNLSRRIFIQNCGSRTDQDFVRRLNAPDEGYCIVVTPSKSYRLECSGRKCKFYLSSEKQCVLNKFFM